MTIGYVTPQDLVDAIGQPSYMAVFDDGNTNDRATVDASTPVTSALRRAHARTLSFLPRIYDKYPPESPQGVNAADGIPILLKDAELTYATAFAYQRHPEFVKTFGAQPGGPMMKAGDAMMESIATTVMQIAPADAPPESQPEILLETVTDNSHRIAIDSADGTYNGGDF